MMSLISPLQYSSLSSRHLHLETARFWKYGIGEHNGVPVQVAQYAVAGGTRTVAQKWRSKDKDFGWVGDQKAAETLFGRHLWRDTGKRVIVTEGEIDAMSMSQVMDHRWPVVSLSNGAGSAERAFRDNLGWLESFEEVVIMFDMDEDGQSNAVKAAAVLSPGRARIARLPLKDANEMLVAGRQQELIKAQWEARIWRPDGILEGPALWARASDETVAPCIPYPWAGLNEKLAGMRRKELVVVTAGSGIGKSSFCRELAIALMRAGEKVGIVALEENARQTLLGLLGILMKVNYRTTPPVWEDLEPVWREQLEEKLALVDHFGSTDIKTLEARIRYLIKGLGCTFVILDHITMATSGEENDNERRAIDITMTMLRRTVEETGAGMLVVSHLKRRAQGAGFERGAEPHLSDLRGSAALEQVSDVVIALARDQAENDLLARIYVRKNRPLSTTGAAGILEWNNETGAYEEVGNFEELV